MRRARRGRYGKRHNLIKHEFNAPLAKKIATWSAEILVVVLMAYVVATFLAARTTVVGQSMAPTVEDGDSILVNKFSYVFSEPKRNDVIVFLPNGNEKSHYYVKRVIGVPGDTVQIKNGIVYINKKPLDEAVNAEPIEEAELADKPVHLKKDEYFVLGDNRNSSEDSRYANIGNIKRKYIVGKAWFRLMPFSKMGKMK